MLYALDLYKCNLHHYNENIIIRMNNQIIINLNYKIVSVMIQNLKIHYIR